MIYALYLISFFSGSIPFGYILYKLFKREDIRGKGSGNIGATNVLRSGGIWIGMVVGILDISKAAIPVLICLKNCGQLQGAICGLMAVIGHCFTPFLSFKGGKGVAAYVGSSLFLTPISLGLSVLIFLSSAFITGIVSAGSLLLAASLPILSLILYKSPRIAIIQLLGTAVIYIRHKENIRKILNKGESKIWKGFI